MHQRLLSFAMIALALLLPALPADGYIQAEISMKQVLARTEFIFTAKVEATPDVRVLVRADKEVKYEYLKKLLVAIGAAKIGNVTFSVGEE